MKTSFNGINLIKQFEGLKLKAYQDVVGVWTIGYGTTRISGCPVVSTNYCTEEQATDYLQNDLVEIEATINKCVTVPINQNQFDALVDFCYNLGTPAFKKSTLLKQLNSGCIDCAANQFLLWNKAGGKPVAGLTKRRAAESKLFLTA
jgi:lysozyme